MAISLFKSFFGTWFLKAKEQVPDITEAKIHVVSPRPIQKHYTNAPRIAMIVQQSKIKCRTQVYGFHVYSLTQSIAMIKKSFKDSGKTPFSMIKQERLRE